MRKTKRVMGSQNDLAKEFLECSTPYDMSIRSEARFAQCFLQKFGHLKPDSQYFTLFLFLDEDFQNIKLNSVMINIAYCGILVFKCGREHIREQLQRDR